MDNFVRLTEDLRRERNLRIDAGDETAVLKFQRPQNQKGGYSNQQSRGNYGQQSRGNQGKGGSKASHHRGPPPPPRSDRSDMRGGYENGARPRTSSSAPPMSSLAATGLTATAGRLAGRLER